MYGPMPRSRVDCDNMFRPQLDPEMGSWQSTTDPIDTTWSSVLTYTSADGSKKLMIQFPSGDTIVSPLRTGTSFR